jgi:multicomponent Na+:H+ antiporter subunit B
MNRSVRIILFLFAAAGMATVLLWSFIRLAGFGGCRARLGLNYNSLTVVSRHITNAPTAVNFDFRAIDTMGEEFILFASVVGSLVLLRTMRREEEHSSSAQERDPGVKRIAGPSDAVRLFGLMLISLLVVFGIYIIAHAHLTPGGGFQGGAIIGTAALLIYLIGGYEIYHQLSREQLMEFCHASAAAAYVIIGITGMLAGEAFLQNFLPLGTVRRFASGGTILVINDIVGVEVSFGFAIMFHEFVAQSRRSQK